MFRKFAFLAALLALPSLAFGQTYPNTNPTYTPNATKAAAATGATVVFVTANIGTTDALVAGSPVGLTGQFQGSTDVPGAASPTWVNIVALPVGAGTVGSGIVLTVTSTGVYRLRTTGFNQVRFNQTALSSGSYTVAYTGSNAPTLLDTSTIRRTTYAAVINALVPAATATDFFTLNGSATTTVRVLSAWCSGTSTANAAIPINAVRRSTANATGTSTSPAATNFDALDPAATAVAKAYTVNPGTLGTIVGTALSTGILTTNTVATSTTQTGSVVFNFDQSPSGEEVVLRGVAQTFALNAIGASFTAGTSLTCAVKWTEE